MSDERKNQILDGVQASSSFPGMTVVACATSWPDAPWIPAPMPPQPPSIPGYTVFVPIPITVSLTTHPDTADLLELLAAIDDFVRGKAITEEIMGLRTKAAIIRDRMARRNGPRDDAG